MSSRPNKTWHQLSGEEGFTLLEVLVAMTIFIVITGAIFGLLKVGQQTRTSVSNNVQLTKSLRLGLNLIGRDTYNAGHGYPLDNAVIQKDNRFPTLIGVPVDLNATGDRIPPVIAGNNITLNTFNTTPGVRTDQVTFLFKDVSFNLTGPSVDREVAMPLAVDTLTTGSGFDELTLKTAGAAAAECRVNDLFLIAGKAEGGFGQDGAFTLGMVTGINAGANKLIFSNSDPLNFNDPVTNPQQGELRRILAIGADTNIVRVKMVTYFVTADGTLTRREFGNVPPPGAPAVGYVDEALVYGVENFQVQYVMDDGALMDNPSAGPDGIAGNADDDQTFLARVRQVRVMVAAKTTEFDARGVPVRVNQSATFATRNLGYDAN